MDRQSIGDDSSGYAPAVLAPRGRLVAVSGLVAKDAAGGIAGDSVGTQARFIFAAMEELLVEAGGSLADVIRLTAYLTRMDRYAEYVAVRSEVFAALPKPASAAVGVAALIDDRLVIEIDALAVIPDA